MNAAQGGGLLSWGGSDLGEASGSPADERGSTPNDGFREGPQVKEKTPINQRGGRGGIRRFPGPPN